MEFLRRHGCSEYQGFLFSPAVPPDAFAELLRRGIGLDPRVTEVDEERKHEATEAPWRLAALAASPARSLALPARRWPRPPVRSASTASRSSRGSRSPRCMDVLQDRRGLHLAGHRGRAEPLRRHRLQGLQARPGRSRPRCPSSFVWDVEEDAAGDLWIATARRARPLGAGHRPLRPPGDARPDGTSAPCASPQGQTCSGSARATRASSASTWRPGQSRASCTTPRDAGSLGDDRVYALLLDAQGRLWVGTRRRPRPARRGRRGASRTSCPTAARPVEPQRRQGARPRSTTSTGALWVGTSGRRPEPAGRRDRALRALPPRPERAAQPRPRPGARDPAATRTAGSGSARAAASTCSTRARARSPTTGSDPRNPSSLADDHVISLAQDRGGVLWVGTRLGGVHKWNPLSWQFGHVAPDPEQPDRASAAAT